MALFDDIKQEDDPFEDWRHVNDLKREYYRLLSERVEVHAGRVVKGLGDGIMAVFRNPIVAVRAVCAAQEAIKLVEVQGYTPRMRVGIHTGRPQRLGADWLGVDVNIAARVMERAAKGGIMVSAPTLDLVPQSELDALGVVAKRVRKPVFASKLTGIPPDLAIYRLKTGRDLPAADTADDAEADAS